MACLGNANASFFLLFSCLSDITQCSSDGYSIAIWIKVAAWMLNPSVGDRYILSSGGQTYSVTTGGMTLLTLGGKLRIGFITRNPPRRWAIDNIAIEGDEWYHLAATWNKDGYLTGYINGKQWAQVNSAVASMSNAAASSVMYAGKPNNYEGEYGEISLDDWCFWRRVLKIEEVEIIYDLYFMN